MVGTIRDLVKLVRNVLRCGRELLGYVLAFLHALALPRAVLAARLIAAESQLAVCRERIQQKQDPKPRFSHAFRFLWVVLSKVLTGWEQCVQLMQPATVTKWHTRASRFLWRWRSRREPGRQPIPREMQELIRRLSRENPCQPVADLGVRDGFVVRFCFSATRRLTKIPCAST